MILKVDMIGSDRKGRDASQQQCKIKMHFEIVHVNEPYSG